MKQLRHFITLRVLDALLRAAWVSNALTGVLLRTARAVATAALRATLQSEAIAAALAVRDEA